MSNKIGSSAYFPGQRSLLGFIGIVIAAAFALGIAMPRPASAQIVERGVEGGVLGAIIGGAVGGGKGVGRGAAIGAGVGVAAGAIERDQRKQAYRRHYGPPPPPPPPPHGGYASLVAKTQVALSRLGYQPGPVDGQMGPGTASAIRRYQYAWGLPVTGQPSYPLLHHMHEHGG